MRNKQDRYSCIEKKFEKEKLSQVNMLELTLKLIQELENLMHE